jgi:hypothetical protein
MNITEKLAEAVATGNWQLISDVHESLTGKALEIPEHREVGTEIIEGLQGFVDSLKRGNPPMVLPAAETKDVNKEVTTKLSKKVSKKKKKTKQNVIVVDDEDSADLPDEELEFHQPTSGEARPAGPVRINPSKVQLISTPQYEGELERRIKEAEAVEGTGPKKRSAYREIKYKCIRCNKKKKSVTRLSKEEIDVFICDNCGTRR